MRSNSLPVLPHEHKSARKFQRMNASVLHPPNGWSFSDKVIGDVVQRVRASPDIATPSVATAWEHTRVPQFQSAGWTTPHQVKITHVGRQAAEAVNGRTDSKPQVLPVKVHKTSMSEPLANNKSEALFETRTKSNVSVADLIAMGQESLREARRQNQRRYRKKQHDNMVGLEKETSQLQAEINQLEDQRRALAATVPEGACIWSVAIEYFLLFQHGLREQQSAQHPSPPSDVAQGKETCSAQVNFLRSRLAPDVILNDGRGVDAAIYCWRRISFWFEDFQLELEHLHKGGPNVLLATTITSFTITERTLRNVFPGIWNERESAVGAPLVDKLLRQRIVMRGTTRFEWDSSRRRVSSVIAQSDLMTPMLRLLGSLKDVEQVFGNAIISPDFRWRMPS
ncbi:unnamed protein product [Phytophthora fragariaefolia]|uniref:Unnamed protein product n=1 Tax=Phytophthora fragariaefolia TaxID=1490495 RepID=A0A9W6Y1G4_9STRA|nr:unnamed protein product [Phytophthora fragariaefolia]